MTEGVHLLLTTDASVEEVGYQDGVTLRTLPRRKTGRGYARSGRGP